MAKLFLSYAREDADKARQLTRLLELDGHTVWWDDSIKGGESFSREIEQALADADVVLVLWSFSSVQSSWVRDEAAFGRDAGKLLPICLDETPPPLGFRQVQSINFAGWTGRRKPDQFDRVGQAIAAAGNSGKLQGPEAAPRAPARQSIPAFGRSSAVALGLLVVITVGGLTVWKTASKGPTLTVAVVPSTESGDRKLNGSYAASIGSDLAMFLAAQAQDASVLDPSGGKPRDDDFRFNVAVTTRGQSAEASTSLSVPKERRIIWSQDWTVPDLRKTDLKQQMAFAASRALQCALEGKKGDLRSSLMNTYVTACVDFSAGDQSDHDLPRIYSELVRQEPDFAPAWEALAVLYGSQVLALIYQDEKVPAEYRRRTVAAIENSRRLNPRSGKAYMAEGALAGKDRLTHLKMMERAVEVEPNTAMLHAVLANHLRTVGRMDESIEEAQKAVALDPLSSGARAAYIRALVEGGRTSTAISELAKAEKIWPNSASIQRATFGVNTYYGDAKRAEQLLSTLSLDEDGLTRFRSLLRARESPTEPNVEAAIAVLRSAAEANPPYADQYAGALAMFGKIEDAFAVLTDSRYRRFIDSSILFLPEFKEVRSDARFMAVANDFGLVKYWTVSGHWPDFCSKPGLSYNCRSEAKKYLTSA
jgi:tetratricopeptide (TPR) repeat protein